jgi:hypothetical protein
MYGFLDASLTGASQLSECMGKENAAGYAVAWSHYQPPYQAGFDIPNDALQALSPGQRQALDIFQLTKKPESMIRVITRAQAGIMDS